MNIAACYIVRDEAENLRRSIASLHGCYDTLLVVDTGSRDATVETAQALGAVVRSFTWGDDFAVARNFALDELRRLASETDWVIFLDADEYFSAATAGHIRRVITSAAAAGQSALLVRRVSLETATGAVLSEEPNLRIFALRPERRYRGRIHEELRDSGRPLDGLALVPRADLLLYHTGYAQEVNRPKAERNLRILQQELQEAQNLATPEERRAAAGRLYMYLAEACRGVGDTAAALRYAQLDIAQGRRPVVFASRSYHIALALLAQQIAATEPLRQPELLEQREQLAVQAVHDFPELPELWAEYGSACLGRGNLAGAMAALERSLRQQQPVESLEPRQFGEQQRNLVHRLWKQLQQVQTQPLQVTACLIMRDAAADLPDWLADASQFADHIIIGDTGSTDDSVAMARAAGAEVLTISASAGEGLDFAAARNQVLERAAQYESDDAADWIVFLDADERLAAPQYLRGQLQLLGAEVQGVLVPLVNTDSDEAGRELSRFPALRIWRPRPGRRYLGRIHEALYDGRRSDGTPQALPRQQIVPSLLAYHTGYSSTGIRAKMRRNLLLLKQEIDQHGEQPWQWRYLADCCFGLGDYVLASHYAELAIERGPATVEGPHQLYALWLTSLRRLGRPLAEREAAARKAVAAFPEDEEFTNELDSITARQRVADWYALQTEGQELTAALNTFLSENEARTPGFGRLCIAWASEQGEYRLLQALANCGQPVPEAGLVELAATGCPEELAARLPGAFGEALQDLFAALYMCRSSAGKASAEEWWRAAHRLPAAMQRVLQRSTGSHTSLMAADYDAWQSGLLALTSRVAPERLDLSAYAALAWDFAPDWGMVVAAAEALEKQSAWQAALDLLGLVPAEAATGDFWLLVGICLYELEQSGAAECFSRARAGGCQRPELRAYEEWSRI